MPSVIHAGELGPRVVDRVVAEQAVRGIRSVLGRNTTSDVEHTALAGHTGKADGLVAWHAGSIAPISSRGVVDLDQTRGFNGRV